MSAYRNGDIFVGLVKRCIPLFGSGIILSVAKHSERWLTNTTYDVSRLSLVLPCQDLSVKARRAIRPAIAVSFKKWNQPHGNSFLNFIAITGHLKWMEKRNNKYTVYGANYSNFTSIWRFHQFPNALTPYPLSLWFNWLSKSYRTSWLFCNDRSLDEVLQLCHFYNVSNWRTWENCPN